MGCYWKYSTSSVWAASKFTLPRLRRQGEFDPVWVHVQAWRLCHWKAAASHETWTTVMEITGSADETEMTKNTRDAAHEHAAASINVMTEKRNVPLEMTKTSFTGCNFAIKCTTHLCQSNHVTSKNKHWLSLMTKWSSLSMLEHLKPWDKLNTGLESSVQLKLSLCASLPAAASCALLEGECSCRAQQLSWSRSAYTSNQNEPNTSWNSGLVTAKSIITFTDELHQPAAVRMDPFSASVMRTSNTHSTLLSCLRSPHDQSTIRDSTKLGAALHCVSWTFSSNSDSESKIQNEFTA